MEVGATSAGKYNAEPDAPLPNPSLTTGPPFLVLRHGGLRELASAVFAAEPTRAGWPTSWTLPMRKIQALEKAELALSEGRAASEARWADLRGRR